MPSGAGTRIQKKEYRKFIITLVDEITRDIFVKLKYVLRDAIPSATLEKMHNPLDLFISLEKCNIIGPENLDGLRELLEIVKEPDLVSMLNNFASSFGISPAKATARPHLMMDGYTLCVQGGQHYFNESVGEYVELTSGSGYALFIRSFKAGRCRCTIKIDGHTVFPGSIINPFQCVTIERPYQRNGKFKFLALDHATPGSGINKWKPENGLVKATFTPEKADMRICFSSNVFPGVLWCSNETTDVSLRQMIVSAFYFDEAMQFSVYFGCKPIGQRNIKLTEYGLRDGANVEIKFSLVGGGLHVPPSVTQHSENDNEAAEWIPGATTLQGESEQTFAEITQHDDFVPDEEKSTTLYLRLVARADDNPPVSNEECTPLARETLIPPPLANW